jgi:RNA polymerase sigma factor (sigma-70 family)
MVKPDSQHRQACEAFVRLDGPEAKRRMGITDYRADDYIPSEVLATVVRTRFGKHNGVLDLAAATLFDRTVRLVGAYLKKNSGWDHIVSSSSETHKDIVSYIWEKLLADKAAVCFAEARFTPFIERRTSEYLLSRTSLKNQARSLDAIQTRDEDGQSCPAAELIEDEASESPEIATSRAQVSEALKRGLLALEPTERSVIYFRILHECSWELTAKYLGCSITTAKKHLSKALEKLRGEPV